jgi:hypothetical protein
MSHYSTGGQAWLVSDLLTGMGGGQCARLGCDGKWRSRNTMWRGVSRYQPGTRPPSKLGRVPAQ